MGRPLFLSPPTCCPHIAPMRTDRAGTPQAGLAEMLAELGDDVKVSISLEVTVGQLRAAVVNRPGPMVVTGSWLTENLGMTAEWWAAEARSGRVVAWQERVGSPWRYDRESCQQLIARHLHQRRRRGGMGSRGPRKVK